MAFGKVGRGFRNAVLSFFRAGNTVIINPAGLFIYSGTPAKGSLIAAAVSAAVTDPYGDQVQAVLTAGQWSAITGLPSGTSMVDQFGNLTVSGTDNVARLRIFTGADGIAHHNAGAVWWLNDFGAVIQIIDPTISATIQYRDNGSAVQGGVIGAQVAGISSIVDPITGAVLIPGVTLIDPIFGDNINIAGDVVSFDQVAMTRKAIISSQDPAAPNALGPFLQVDAPEHTNANHWQGIYLGESSDGTVPPKAVFDIRSGNGSSPVVNTNDFLELQPQSGQAAIQAFMQLVTDHALNTRVTGDTNDRFSVIASPGPGIAAGPGNAAQDVNFYRTVVPTTGAIFRTDGDVEIGKTLNIPARATNPHVGVDAVGQFYLVDVNGLNAIFRNTGNGPQVTMPAGNVYQLSTSHFADTSPHTSTAATFTNVSAVYTINASDSFLGRVYKLNIIGHGQQGTTAQNLLFQAAVAGLTVPAIEIPAASIPVSATFTWEVELKIVMHGTGAGATCDMEINATVGFGNTATIGVTQCGITRGAAFDTTVAQSVAVQSAWGAVVGAPTMTADDNWLERIALERKVMSYYTPSTVLILLALIVLVLILGLLARLFLSEQPLTYAGFLRGIRNVFSGTAGTTGYEDYETEYDEDEDDDWDDDYEDKNESEPGPDSEKAVEIRRDLSPSEQFNVRDLTLRLTKPHLYAGAFTPTPGFADRDWYEDSRRDLSAWAAEQWRLIYEHRKVMGLAA